MGIKFKIFIFAPIFILVFLIFFLKQETLLAPSNSNVCFDLPAQAGNNCFNVELAKTNSQREKGLMYRNSLDKNKGMLFIFDKESIYPFWMKNTLIPLDMIWISKNKKIVFINENTQPCKETFCPSIVPPVIAKYVLEINAGIAKEIGLKIGDEFLLQ